MGTGLPKIQAAEEPFGLYRKCFKTLRREAPRRSVLSEEQKAARVAALEILTLPPMAYLLMIHLTLSLHLLVFLHHFLSHLFPFGLLVGRQDCVHFLYRRFVDFLHLRLFISRG